MRVLIIGSGGREHALAWKVAQSPRVQQVHVAPGNAGTAAEAHCVNVSVAMDDCEALVRHARDENIDLCIVGPEAPLVAGVVDAFAAAGLRCFGPTAAAARLEGSKAYCKDFLARHGIPTAAWRSFTDPAEAEAYLTGHPLPVVVKADGLAAGKGVVIAHSLEEARVAVHAMLSGHAFGAAGTRVVIEEFLPGEEASYIVLADGVRALPFATSQDHKRLLDGDRGPNTGGMGAYTPAPLVTPAIERRVLDEVIAPTLRGMAADGLPYTGFLYAGLMIGPDGTPRVLEYNCRLGDPETQPILMRLRSDLVDLVEAALEGRLDGVSADWDPRPALGVVMAADGYPADYRKGDVIDGLDAPEEADVQVFHAATALRDGKVVTAGGRVLCVCALGDDLAAAQRRAYGRVARIGWPGVQFRSDIGWRALGL